MPKPSGRDRDETSNRPRSDRSDQESMPVVAVDTDRVEQQPGDPGERVADSYAVAPAAAAEQPTEVIVTPGSKDQPQAETPKQHKPERRFTAPGFDAGETEIIVTAPDPATEVFATAQGPTHTPTTPPRKARPQLIPPRLVRRLPSSQRSWGWVLALIVVILALAAIVVLGTALLTRGNQPKASQEDRVRNTIQKFDIAVQTGDLAALRGMTCGNFRDGYVNYNENEWADVHGRVAAAKQYPVVASIDQVVVNGEHAEANVTAFMAYAPQIRSTRSFDLQFRDDQWKVCQTPNG